MTWPVLQEVQVGGKGPRVQAALLNPDPLETHGLCGAQAQSPTKACRKSVEAVMHETVVNGWCKEDLDLQCDGCCSLQLHSQLHAV